MDSVRIYGHTVQITQVLQMIALDDFKDAVIERRGEVGFAVLKPEIEATERMMIRLPLTGNAIPGWPMPTMPPNGLPLLANDVLRPLHN